MTGTGALAGIVVGGITVVAWKQVSGGLFDLYEIVPGILLGTLAIVLTSLRDRPPPEHVRMQFEEVGNRLRESGIE